MWTRTDPSGVPEAGRVPGVPAQGLRPSSILCSASRGYGQAVGSLLPSSLAGTGGLRQFCFHCEGKRSASFTFSCSPLRAAGVAILKSQGGLWDSDRQSRQPGLLNWGHTFPDEFGGRMCVPWEQGLCPYRPHLTHRGYLIHIPGIKKKNCLTFFSVHIFSLRTQMVD